MAMGLRIAVAEATTEGGFRPAFELMTRERAGAIVIAGDPLFTSHREGLAEMAALRQAPSIYVLREYAAAGGLMSYGGSFEDAHRLCGAYAARILRGARPAELPVVMSAKFDLVVNLRTAKALGLVIPPDILAGADELIE
jgi:putative ABC transport system substrate-binding protein